MSMMYMVWNFPGHFGSAVLSQPLAYSQPTHGAAELETEKALVLWCLFCVAQRQQKHGYITCTVLVTYINHSPVLEESHLHPNQTQCSCFHHMGTAWQSQSCSLVSALKIRNFFFPASSLTFTISEVELLKDLKFSSLYKSGVDILLLRCADSHWERENVIPGTKITYPPDFRIVMQSLGNESF